MHIRLRSERTNLHVFVTVFAGADKEHLANCGKLCFRVREWRLFSEVLKSGARCIPGGLIVDSLELDPMEAEGCS